LLDITPTDENDEKMGASAEGQTRLVQRYIIPPLLIKGD
jgi:hypothetical protein